MDKFHISSTGLSMNYMPHYLARELGFFEEVGLDVTVSLEYCIGRLKCRKSPGC